MATDGGATTSGVGSPGWVDNLPQGWQQVSLGEGRGVLDTFLHRPMQRQGPPGVEHTCMSLGRAPISRRIGELVSMRYKHLGD